jgi:hypothetical protein
VHAVLDRHSLVRHRSRRRPRLTGTPLSWPSSPNRLWWCADYKRGVPARQSAVPLSADHHRLRQPLCWHAGPRIITTCGRICYQRRKINVSQVFAGQKVGVKQTDDHIWLVTFMDYDLGYFDDETCRLEPIENPFGPKLLPMSPK